MTAIARSIRVLDLRSVWGTGGGPEKTILSGAAASDSARFATTVCYVRDARDPVFAIDRRAAALGVDYAELTERHSFDAAIWPALRRLVRARAIDIVHSHDYKTNLLACLLSKCDGVIAVSTAHGWTGHSRRERWIYYPADKRVLSTFDHVIAVSREIQAELVRAGAAPSRTSVVLNGIDPSLFRRDNAQRAAMRIRHGLPEDAIVIGSVGRLEPQKRFDLLLEALAIMNVHHPDVHVVIAGAGSQQEALERQVDRLKLTGRCHLLGHVTDIAALHHAFDLFVQTSDYEGTPNAVLEAMALETPIIATSVGGTSDLVEDGRHGVLINPGDPHVVVSAVEGVLADRAGAATRATRARRRIENELSFKARMTAVEAVYEELFANRITGRNRAEAVA